MLVTHSHCLNALEDEKQSRLLNFSAGREDYFGVSVLLRQKEDGRVDLLGCVLPSQWQEAQDKEGSL